MPHKTTVKTNGQTLLVNASVSHWTTEALALAASGTNDVESTTTTTITGDYDLWFANTATTATITVKQADGTPLATYTGLQVNPGVGSRVLSPLPTVAQLAAAEGADSRLSTAPAGAVAETFPRNGATMSNQAVLTTARMFLTAIEIESGVTVSSATFLSGTTAANTPVNQWFALYDRNKVLLGQTADDTTTAWGASTAKTLSFAAPITTTYSGMYYVGIMVKATTPPSLYTTVTVAALSGIAPTTTGQEGTAGLSDTAPDPAGAITAGVTHLYAYLS